jgi:hypothetical protein
MKVAHYWEKQEQRWYEQYLEAEKTIDTMEMALRQIEEFTFTHECDPMLRSKISKLIDATLRGSR